MPIYEYLCEKCDYEFEREQRISDPPVKTCPECRSRKVTKLISKTSFVLKGGGWYSDLYSSQKPGQDKESGADAKSDAADKKPKKDSKDVLRGHGVDGKQRGEQVYRINEDFLIRFFPPQGLARSWKPRTKGKRVFVVDFENEGC